MHKFSTTAVMMTMVAVVLMSAMVSVPTWAADNAELRKGIEDAQQNGNLQAAMKLSRELEASEVHDGDWGFNGKCMANLLFQTKGPAAKLEYLRAAFAEAVEL
ncbi:MAG: hypothetical protein FWE88_09770, partial [Phycisphaerae bacterium]|nr:hypothetical protein [Phycisphaerae bacterium]